jgi:hypothetical protein
VTIATGASAIDPHVASRPVLLAIPGATEGLADALLDSRRMWSDPGAADAVSFAAAAPYVMISQSRDFTIAATAKTSDGAQYRAELQVRLTGRAAQPYQVIAWRTPTADRDAATPAKQARVP